MYVLSKRCSVAITTSSIVPNNLWMFTQERHELMNTRLNQCLYVCLNSYLTLLLLFFFSGRACVSEPRRRAFAYNGRT